ncbi:MAG: cobalamin B12-binding domain-containing protein [Pseudomonadota bacterium]
MDDPKSNSSLTLATREGRRALCDDDLRITDEAGLEREESVPSRLTTVINGEIIPRLFVLNNQQVVADQSVHEAGLRLEDYIVEYARIILEDESNRAFTFVEQLHADGHQLDRIMMDLLAPTARQLGVWWEEDRIDFVDVTIGTSRLKQVLHHFRPSRQARVYAEPNPKRILLLPTPQETHTFGLLVIAEIFRKSGWEVGGGHVMADDEMNKLLSEEPWDIVGFSLANARLMDKLANAIASARWQSKNKSVKILVGGRAFSKDLKLDEKLGADFVVSDPAQAVKLGEALLSDQRGRSLVQ